MTTSRGTSLVVMVATLGSVNPTLILRGTNSASVGDGRYMWLGELCYHKRLITLKTFKDSLKYFYLKFNRVKL